MSDADISVDDFEKVLLTVERVLPVLHVTRVITGTLWVIATVLVFAVFATSRGAAHAEVLSMTGCALIMIVLEACIGKLQRIRADYRERLVAQCLKSS